MAGKFFFAILGFHDVSGNFVRALDEDGLGQLHANSAQTATQHGEC